METPTIAVVDYHKGNLSSVARGLDRAGARALVTDSPREIAAADGIVLPGVGSFFDAITFMHERGQDRAVIDAVAAGTPFLGICLGLQLLFSRGDEGVPSEGGGAEPVVASDARGTGLAPGAIFEAEGKRWVRGLGVLEGSCTRLSSRRLKVPHVGWDQMHLTPAGQASALLAHVAEGANVYFTHSYALDDDCDPSIVLARTHYVRSFPCIIGTGNIYGCQFHPEKSSVLGLEMLANFTAIARVSGASGGDRS